LANFATDTKNARKVWCLLDREPNASKPVGTPPGQMNSSKTISALCDEATFKEHQLQYEQ
jgi:hypothetical protein